MKMDDVVARKKGVLCAGTIDAAIEGLRLEILGMYPPLLGIDR